MIDAIALHRPATLSRIGLAAALAISLAAVAAATPQAAFAQGTLTWAVPSDVTGTDPQNNGQTVSKNILSLVYEQLMTLDDGVNPSPLLAESYDMESPTRYVFTLRDGVSFTNGRALSVNDVVKSFERILDPDTASPLRGRLLMIDTIEALDARRIAFNLKTPYAGFLASVADSNAMIMPMDEFAAGTFDPTRELIGTGPFVVSAHSKDASWTLVRNPNYWQAGLPKLDQVDIRVIGDQGTMLAGLRNGSVDIANFDGAEVVSQLETIPNVTTTVQSNTNYYVITLNTAKAGPLDNQKLRQAINKAIDRDQISEIALGGVERPVGPAPDLAQSCNIADLPFSQHDLEAAKALLAEAGGAPAQTFKITYNSAGQDYALIGQVVQQQLADLGVSTALDPLPSGDYLTKFREGTMELGISFYATGTDPYVGLSNWDPALAAWTAGLHGAVPAISEKLPAVAETSGDARADLIKDVCLEIDADSAMIPLVSRSQTVAWRSDLVNAEVLPVEVASYALRNIVNFTRAD